MKILSTLALIALAAQCTLATPERRLLRAGYDRPFNFANLTDLTPTKSGTQTHGSDVALPSIDSITKGGILPTTTSLPITNAGKNTAPADMTVLAGRSGLNPVTGAKHAYKSSGADLSTTTKSEDRMLKSPKKTPPPTPKSSHKKKPTKKSSPKKTKKSPKPNVKPTPKPDPENSPVQRPVA